MSRIGKKLIAIPNKVEVKIDRQHVAVKGPKGELSVDVHPDITVSLQDGKLQVTRPTDERTHRALHGLTRALVANMVTGVSEGFRKTLVIEGVGYSAELRGKDLVMKLGYSHEIVVNPPHNIAFLVPQDQRGRLIHVDGIDKQVVGQVAVTFVLRPPEPYLGKGVRYLMKCPPESGKSAKA
jgi:large subunit ribosomal protein L6